MPQLHLNRHELGRLELGNQHTKWNVIRWQAVKGEAARYGVTDWTSKIDSSLSYRENLALMRKLSTTARGGPTLRELEPDSLRAKS